MKKKINCILLIDDDEATNYFNERTIRELNIAEEVKVTESAYQALDFLTNAGPYSYKGDIYPRPDLILLDINMPAMTGWDFLEEYKKLPEKQRGKKIILLTTSVNPDDEKRATKILEISMFMRKVLTKERLHDLLQLHFSDYF